MRNLQVFILATAILVPMIINAQTFTNDDYKKALWMTTRMYGGQRSGAGYNWLIMDHKPEQADLDVLISAKGLDMSQLHQGISFTKDADGEHSLTGGWHDCGDHVKFGQTEFYSAYTLLKGYAEIPQGYDDYYSFDYKGYFNSGNYSWEGKNNEHQGVPNGIPDILDEVKYATDYFIKCARNSTTFYSQVGDGDNDHKNWVTSVAMAALPIIEGGQNDGSRPFVKNPNGASMASFCSGTLALMSKVYRKFDPEYADLCLEHAIYAYEYAAAHPGTVDAGRFYPANKKWEDDFIIAATELYWATGEEKYKTKALSMSAELTNHNYAYCYNNNDDIAAYNLAKLGDETSRALLEHFVDLYKTNVKEGLFDGGDSQWGPLRYNATTAFIVALWNQFTGTEDVDEYVTNQINYILGGNSANHSFVVGFERKDCANCTSAKHPHHRNVFQVNNNSVDKNSVPIPEKNRQHGYMIGGTRNPSAIDDDIENIYQNEGGIDYNSGLVGAIAYIVSRIAPVDTNRFGHPTPELGDNISICGVESVTISADIDLSYLKEGEAVTFKWYKDGASSPFEEGVDAKSVSVSDAGEYTCVVQETSEGVWSTSDKVSVLAELPTFSLGESIMLCSPAFTTLDVDVQGEGITYSWKKDGKALASDEKTLTVYQAGEYSATISASGCESKTVTVIVESQLPEVEFDTICSAGLATLEVSGESEYEWHDSPESETPLFVGNLFETEISNSTTYYIKDAGSMSLTVGPEASDNSLSGSSNGGSIGMTFTAQASFDIVQLTVEPFIYDESNKVTVTFDLLQNGAVVESYTSDMADNGGDQQPHVLTFSTPIVIPGAGDYTLKPNGGNQLVWYNGGADYGSFGKEGVITITGDTRNDQPGSFPAIFDIVIQTGSQCDKAPALAIIDPTHPLCAGGVDTDKDGTPDNLDGCPLDANKTEPGNCGCGKTEESCDPNSQLIVLEKGWNLVSFNVEPNSLVINDIFEPVLNQILYVKNSIGFYAKTNPSFLNSLSELDLTESYLIYADDDVEFTVTGNEINTMQKSLMKGWNYIAYPLKSESEVEDYFSTIWNEFETLKDFTDFYEKGAVTNTLHKLKPGIGYFIYVSGTTLFDLK